MKPPLGSLCIICVRTQRRDFSATDNLSATLLCAVYAWMHACMYVWYWATQVSGLGVMI